MARFLSERRSYCVLIDVCSRISTYKGNKLSMQKIIIHYVINVFIQINITFEFNSVRLINPWQLHAEGWSCDPDNRNGRSVNGGDRMLLITHLLHQNRLSTKGELRTYPNMSRNDPTQNTFSALLLIFVCKNCDFFGSFVRRHIGMWERFYHNQLV